MANAKKNRISQKQVQDDRKRKQAMNQMAMFSDEVGNVHERFMVALVTGRVCGDPAQISARARELTLKSLQFRQEMTQMQNLNEFYQARMGAPEEITQEQKNIEAGHKAEMSLQRPETPTEVVAFDGSKAPGMAEGEPMPVSNGAARREAALKGDA